MLYIDRHIGIVLICSMEYDIFRYGGYAGKPQPTNGRSPIKNCPWAYPFTTERLKVPIRGYGMVWLPKPLRPCAESKSQGLLKKTGGAHNRLWDDTAAHIGVGMPPMENDY